MRCHRTVVKDVGRGLGLFTETCAEKGELMDITSTLPETRTASPRSLAAYTLTPRSADVPGINLGLGHYCLGSGPECDIVVDLPGVAEQHCLLMVGPRRIVVKALSPLTWINDGAVRECNFGVGDRLIVGPVEYFLEEAAQFVPVHSESLRAPTGIDEAIASLRPQAKQIQPSIAENSHDNSNDTNSLQDEIRLQKQKLKQLQDGLSHKESILELRQVEIDGRSTELAAEFERLREERQASQSTREKLRQMESGLRQREREVDSRSEELIDREQAVAELQRQVEADAKSLNGRLQEFNTNQHEFADASRRLEQLREEIEATRREAEQNLQSLKEREQALSVRESELQRLLEEFEQAKTQDAARHDELSAQLSEINVREEALRQQLLDLETREATVRAEREQLQAETSAIDAQRTQANEDSDNKLAELAHREEVISGREQVLESRERAVEERETELNSAQRELGEREQQLKVSAESAEQDSTKAEDLAVLEQQLADERAAVESLRAELLSEQDGIESMRLSLEHERETLAAERAELDRIREEESSAEQLAANETAELQYVLGTISDQNADLQLQVEDLSLKLEMKEDLRGQLEDELALQKDELNRREERIVELEWQVEHAVTEENLTPESSSETASNSSVVDEEVSFKLQQEWEELEREQQKCAAERQDLQIERQELEKTRISVDRQASELAETQRWLMNSQDQLAAERAELERDREEFAELFQQVPESLTTEDDLSDELGELLSADEFELHASVTTPSEEQSDEPTVEAIDDSFAASRDVPTEEDDLNASVDAQLEQILGFERDESFDDAVSLTVPPDEDDLHLDFPDLHGDLPEEKLDDDAKLLEDGQDTTIGESNFSSVQAFRLDEQDVESEPVDTEPVTAVEDLHTEQRLSVEEEQSTPEVQSNNAAKQASSKQDGLAGLRSQLAELFGMSKEALHEPTVDPDDETLTNESDASESLSAPDESDTETDEIGAANGKQKKSSAKNDESGGLSSFEEPDSVAAYMERLLARSRATEVDEHELDEETTSDESELESDSASSVDEPLTPLNEINIEPSSESGGNNRTLADSDDTENDLDGNEENLSSRRATTEEERDAIRANLHSFRELANYSARSAVAKSQTARLRTSLKSTSYIVAASWIATGMLATSKLWMGSTQLTTTLVALAASLGLSFRAFMLWLEIKKHQVDTPSTFDEVELSGKESVTE
ncbi:MAG: hypothetical protein KDA66_03175 [Planctomycetaceae bacterium]|nr:hypothetical protein [Planctomycetaceae bacterium]